MEQKETQLNVLIPKDLKQQLEIHAAKNGKKLKVLVATVLGEYLEKNK